MLYLVELEWRGPIDGWWPAGVDNNEAFAGLWTFRADPTKGGKGLLWHPRPLKGAILIADDLNPLDRVGGKRARKLEPLSDAARIALQNIGDKSISIVATTLPAALRELTTVHARTDGSRHRPSKVPRDGKHKIWLGGQLVDWWRGKVPPGTTTKTETFPTPGTDLTAGQNQTWVHELDTPRVVAGSPNAVRQNTAGNDTRVRTTSPSIVDTDNNYAQATCNATNGSLESYAIVGCRKVDSATYTCYDTMWRRGAGNPAVRTRSIVGGSGTTIDNVVADVAGPAVVLIQANGDQINGAVGATTFGPTTNTDVATGRSAELRLLGGDDRDAQEIRGDLQLTDVGYSAGGGKPLFRGQA